MTDETSDLEEVVEADLESLIGLGARDASIEAEKPRYACAGSRRIDEDTGKKLCDYRAVKKWYGACPKCDRLFACLHIKKGKNSETRVTLGQETMDAAKALVYHPTGIPELDKVLNGGVVYGHVVATRKFQGQRQEHGSSSGMRQFRQERPQSLFRLRGNDQERGLGLRQATRYRESECCSVPEIQKASS